jgi:hypothetical protein
MDSAMMEACSMNIFQQYLLYGISVIPCKDKIPLFAWKKYQTEFATQEDATKWDGQIACVCGNISGGLIVLDFDVKNGNKFEEWQRLISEKFPEILSKLVIESTPSGGYHIIFKTAKQIGNIKLACNKEHKATIETRGAGGYFVCAPSTNYKLYYGSFDKISKLTDEETEVVLSCAAALNEYFVSEKIPTISDNIGRTGLTPCDDYDVRTNIGDLLVKHGWKESFSRGDKRYFQRPGKEGRGVSASWNAIPGRFYVFSTSTNFENEHIYKPSAVYAILEHGGDFSKAAKELYTQGYGKRIEHLTGASACILQPTGMKNKIAQIKLYGYPRGKTTGWKTLDEYYSVIKGQFTVITGMPSHGKSQLVDAMMMNLAIAENWKFGIFSPENYPTEMHYHQLIEKYVGKSLWKMTDTESNTAIDFIDSHFFFIDATEDEINLEAILYESQNLINEKHIDGLSLDPWNEIEMDKPKDLSTTEYIGKSLRISRKFARRNNIHLWIAVHPIKMQKDKDGKYPIPELYDCEGSAMWRNKADNGLCVYRENMDENITLVRIQKIKYRYTGKPGEVYLKFLSESGRYEEMANF